MHVLSEFNRIRVVVVLITYLRSYKMVRRDSSSRRSGILRGLRRVGIEDRGKGAGWGWGGVEVHDPTSGSRDKETSLSG